MLLDSMPQRQSLPITVIVPVEFGGAIRLVTGAERDAEDGLYCSTS